VQSKHLGALGSASGVRADQRGVSAAFAGAVDDEATPAVVVDQARSERAGAESLTRSALPGRRGGAGR
jgi:hypothetical protein